MKSLTPPPPHIAVSRPGLLACICLLLLATNASAQTRTIGLIQSDNRAWNGYTLFAPIGYKSTYLIDIDGRLVHSWDWIYRPGNAVYLMKNGHLIRTGVRDQARPGSGGIIQEVDWDGNVIWTVLDTAGRYEFHHDVHEMPNGHILAIAWETKSKQEAIAAGRDPLYFSRDVFFPDVILEFAPDGKGSADIVWEWHFWDHMSSNLPGTWVANGRPVSANITDPKKIDINFLTNGQADWLHCNGVAYNAKLDQVVITAHNSGEIVVVSHATANYADPAAGIEAARGVQGDILYRWGNPAAYGAGTSADQKLFGQHDAHWIEDGRPGAGNILIFNNGLQRPDGPYSTVVEIEPPVNPDGTYRIDAGKAFGPDTAFWIYKASKPTDFYSAAISSAQRLPNGNTLICSGRSGTFFEVTPSGEIVWKYINPVTNTGPAVQGTPPQQNNVFKCRRYGAGYEGLKGKDLTPGDPIEIYQTAVDALVPDHRGIELETFPNPVDASMSARASLDAAQRVTIDIYDIHGRRILRSEHGSSSGGTQLFRIDTSPLPPGRYALRITADGASASRFFAVVR